MRYAAARTQLRQQRPGQLLSAARAPPKAPRAPPFRSSPRRPAPRRRSPRLPVSACSGTRCRRGPRPAAVSRCWTTVAADLRRGGGPGSRSRARCWGDDWADRGGGRYRWPLQAHQRCRSRAPCAERQRSHGHGLSARQPARCHWSRRSASRRSSQPAAARQSETGRQQAGRPRPSVSARQAVPFRVAVGPSRTAH